MTCRLCSGMPFIYTLTQFKTVCCCSLPLSRGLLLRPMFIRLLLIIFNVLCRFRSKFYTLFRFYTCFRTLLWDKIVFLRFLWTSENVSSNLGKCCLENYVGWNCMVGKLISLFWNATKDRYFFTCNGWFDAKTKEGNCNNFIVTLLIHIICLNVSGCLRVRDVTQRLWLM